MIIDFLKERKTVIQIIIVSIVLSLGVRFIGQGLSEILKFSGIENILFGLVFLILAGLFFCYSLLEQRVKYFSISGFIIHDETINELVRIPNYDFAIKLNKYLNSGFLENKGLKKIWDKYKLNDFDAPKNVTRSSDLLLQATEYYFLNNLSLHLLGYFKSKKYDTSKLNILKRNDIPQILFENAFLDLFSKPMDKREAFIDFLQNSNNENPNIIHLSSEIDGHMFENFILTLPKNCVISKPSKNALRINTNKIDLLISHEFAAMEKIDSDNFLNYYTDCNSNSEFTKYTINTNIKISFTFLAYITNLGWNYFKWIDSFIESYNKRFSEKKFFNKINWETIDILINVTKLLNKETK
ncbi:MAG: hypothetical protein Q8909_08960 [Bacteroidota bacterium]|nr:hypothetical protein [Bacteroidota bacterium]